MINIVHQVNIIITILYTDNINFFISFLLAAPIDRPLKIGEIVGAQSTLDNSFYRGQVLDKIDENTYLIQYIDFGDKDYVPLTNVFSIPTDFMVILMVKGEYCLYCNIITF